MSGVTCLIPSCESTYSLLFNGQPDDVLSDLIAASCLPSVYQSLHLEQQPGAILWYCCQQTMHETRRVYVYSPFCFNILLLFFLSYVL